jgi:AraC-like DNA-binding protein
MPAKPELLSDRPVEPLDSGDAMDHVFAAMRVKSAVYARLEANAPWGVRFAGGQSARFGLVLRGGCLLTVEGTEGSTALTAGDCYVLIRGSTYTLADALDSPTRSCFDVIRDKIGGVVELGGKGTRTTVITGWFRFDEFGARPLLELMPPLLHVRMDQGGTQVLHSTLQLLALETAEQRQLGSGVVISRLADVLFVQVIRAHAAGGTSDGVGWLGALSDRSLAPALRAIHQNMSHAWTVEALARIAGMSRSVFAIRFKARLGEAPLEYVARWRMFRAGALLRQSDRSLSEIAEDVGYESEASFCKAFRRTMGLAPGRYRRTVAESRSA